MTYTLGTYILMFPIMVVWIFSSSFKKPSFTKSGILKKLADHDIELKDDFKILSNRDYGILDNIIEFELDISDSDQHRILQQLNDSDFFVKRPPKYGRLETEIPRILTKDTTMHTVFDQPQYINKQSCEVLSSGYIQTWDQIRISKTQSRLLYTRQE